MCDTINTTKEREDKTMTDRMLEMWETIEELGIATTEELGLATALCGNTIETLERVLYIRTGYRTLDQMLDEEE